MLNKREFLKSSFALFIPNLLGFTPIKNKFKGKKFKGIVLSADICNKNKRIYPYSVLESIVRSYEKDTLLGQIDFPDDSLIHLAEVSHKITDLYLENNHLIAEIETLDNKNGKLVESMIEKNSLVLRPYGLGSFKRNNDGNFVISDSYKMISISVVRIEDAA